MQLKYFDNKKDWNDFIASQELSQFLQSWQWGVWQEDQGKAVWRLAVLEDGKILAACQLIQSFVGPRLWRKNYFYLPRGPIFSDQLSQDKREEIHRAIVSKIEELAEQESAMFWRVEFLDQDLTRVLKGFRKVRDIQPAHTWILEIDCDEGEILSQMHHKTRYNIRLADRKGVKIIKAQNKKDIEKFFNTLEATSKRNEFGIYNLEYYQRLFDLLSEETLVDDFTHPDVEVYLAEFEDKVIAGIWVMFFGDTATYLYGGMNKTFSKLMAPHLLQWTAIAEAQERGYKLYDFWGVAPEDAEKSHPWAGLTRFKKQFGGFDKQYPGCFDLVFDKKWYNIYNKFRKIF